MAVEIERKFLVVNDEWRVTAEPGRRFCQGYLGVDGPATVRVRRVGDKAYVTIKGERTGIARAEFEYAIPVQDAEAMLQTLCARPLLEKTRYCVKHAGLNWEVDVFEGEALGMVVAEMELERVDQTVPLPSWAGADVSHDPRYSSSIIARTAREDLP